MSSMSTMSKASLFSHASAAPPDVSREDFDAILDDFLENYEVVGRKYRPALGGTGLTGPEKLSVLRAAIEGGVGEREENRRRVLEVERMTRGKEKVERERVRGEEDEGEKWDVETILSASAVEVLSICLCAATYTNTENHPGMIRSRSAAEAKARAEARRVEQQAEESDSGSETEMEAPKVTVTRPKGEPSAERRERKAALKAERSVS
jgi:protein LTV1